MWLLRQTVLASLVLTLACTASASRDNHEAAARRELSPGLPAPTRVAALYPRQDPGSGQKGGGGGDDGQAQQQAQQQLQQQLQQLSQSFSQRLSQVTQQASQSLSQLSQSVQQFQQSVDSIRQSADSAINSVRSSADSQARQSVSSAASSAASSASVAIASAQAAVSANTCPTCATCPTCPDAQGAPAATVTAFATVTETIKINGASIETDAPAAAAAALPAQSCAADPEQTNAKQAEQQQTSGFDTCTTAGKALAIIGLILGIVGLSALGFTIWSIRRRRTWDSRSESSEAGNNITSPVGLGGAGTKGGLVEKWRNGLSNDGSRPASPASNYKDIKPIRPVRTRAPLKESISKPIRMSFWRWRRESDDRLSFQDIGAPNMSTRTNTGGRNDYP